MRDTPLTSTPVPDSTDAADVPTHLYNALTELEERTNMVFASSAARDAAFTAAGVTPANGHECFLTDTKTKQVYLGSAWVNQESFVICTSGTRPTVTHTGMKIYETDSKSVRVYDGSNWVPTGIRGYDHTGVLSGTEMNDNTSQTLFQGGVSGGNLTYIGLDSWGDASYYLTIPFPTAFPNGVTSVVALPGYAANSPNKKFFVDNSTVSKSQFTVWMTGTSLTNGGATTVNWMAWGW